MDLQRQYETLYQEAQGHKSAGRLTESDAVEEAAAALLHQLKQHVQDHPRELQTAVYLLFLADREWPLLGDHSDVQSKIEQAVAIRETLLGPSDPAIAEALTQLAEFHFLSGRWATAEPLYRRAMALYENSGAGAHALFAKCQGGLAQTLVALNREAEADPYFAEAIARTDGKEENKRILYFLLIQRAEGLDHMGRSPEAAALRRKAADLLPKSNPGEQGFHV